MNALRTGADRALVYGLALVHPQTIFRLSAALARGASVVVTKTAYFARGSDLVALEEKNPTRHAKEVSTRRFLVVMLVVADLLVWSWVQSAIVHGGLLVALAHLAGLVYLGRTERIMTPVMTARIATESMLRNLVDEITTPRARRLEGAASKITTPPHRLPSNAGYEVTVQVHREGDPTKLDDAAPAIAHKHRRGRNQVFVYRVEGDESKRRFVILDEDPWAKPSRKMPLAVSPRRVDLWTEEIETGVLPEGRPYAERLIEPGDGAGRLIGGSPGSGKSVYTSELMTAIALDPGARLHLIDGKGVDYEELKPVCATYLGDEDLDDRELLLIVIEILKGAKEEIRRRKKLLRQHKASKLTPELASELGLTTEWYVIDELAALTEDLRSTMKSETDEVIELLTHIQRMGRAFGVVLILATQRPTEKSVPPALKGMIRKRGSFYVPDVYASQAVLGKAGEAMRADLLDPHRKGVGIFVGVGQLRSYLVEPEDLKRVAAYAASLRAEGPTPTDPADARWPEPVNTIMELFAERGADQVDTAVILDALVRRERRPEGYSANRLASELSVWSIRSEKLRWPDRPDSRGYRKSAFTHVPKVLPGGLPSSSDETDADDGLDDHEDGLPWAANTKEEDR